MLKIFKKIDKNTALAGLAIVAIIIAAILVSSKSGSGFSMGNFLGQSNDDIGKKAIDYINNNGLSGTPATLVSVSSESGLVKIRIKIGSNEFDSYATKDGKFLFPQAFNMAEAGEKNPDSSSAGKTAEEIIASIKKTDKPALEAFIVSRCPFGLQMQRMINEALKTIPSLADYIKVRYIGAVSSDGKSITAMHGDAEAKENLRQICIREEQPAKYWSYTACQMSGGGKESSCEKTAGVDSAKLSACISDPKRGVAFAKIDFDLSDKYGAQGSPTLILDGAEVPEFTSNNQPVFGSSRSADELRAIICAASATQAGWCSTKLNTAQAATSFSAVYASSSSNSGNSGATGANCEPAQ